MSLLSIDAQTKENKGNALAIGKEARDAKNKNSNVIDSTIGMLFDENGEFFTFNCVKKATEALNERQKYAYGSTIGDPAYHEALYKWIFRGIYDDVRNNMHLRCVATPGGSGAICNTFSNYLNEGDKVLLPSLMWTNYIQVAKEEHLGYETYQLFDDNGHFNLYDFKYKCNLLKEQQGRVVVVINDPCQNPTGYSMSSYEWKMLVEILNEVSLGGTPVVLLYDLAYIDYDKRGFVESRNNIKLFKKFNENVLPILAFSGSKTLGLYGLRIGAQICMAKTKAVAEEFIVANDFSARGKWSMTSVLGQSIITKVFNDYNDEFVAELGIARELLIKRANIFIEEAKRVGLKHFPYDCGFFVTIPCDNVEEVTLELKEKGLYIIPLKVGVRLTLSSITVEEVKRAVNILSEVLN